MSIAVVVKKGKDIIIAADTQDSFGSNRVSFDNYRSKKIVTIGDSYVATSGWGVYEDILNDYLATSEAVSLNTKTQIFAFFMKFWKDLHKHYSFVKDDKNLKKSESVNVSTGGVLMTTEEKLEQGSIIQLSMHMPLPGLSCNCAMLGEVVRCEQSEDKKSYRAAVKFTKIVHHNLNKYKYASLKDILNLEGEEISIG